MLHLLYYTLLHLIIENPSCFSVHFRVPGRRQHTSPQNTRASISLEFSPCPVFRVTLTPDTRQSRGTSRCCHSPTRPALRFLQTQPHGGRPATGCVRGCVSLWSAPAGLCLVCWCPSTPPCAPGDSFCNDGEPFCEHFRQARFPFS